MLQLERWATKSRQKLWESARLSHAERRGPAFHWLTPYFWSTAVKDPKYENLVELYYSGLSTKELGRMFGVHGGAIRSALVWRGAKMRKAGGAPGIPRMNRRAKKYSNLVELYESGLSSCELGRMFGVNSETIISSLRTRGATIRPHPKGEGSPLYRRGKREYTAASNRISHYVKNAVRDGIICKPDFCSQCSRKGTVHAHHCDYSKSIDVMWMCPKCHYLWHKTHDPVL